MEAVEGVGVVESELLRPPCKEIPTFGVSVGVARSGPVECTSWTGIYIGCLIDLRNFLGGSSRSSSLLAWSLFRFLDATGNDPLFSLSVDPLEGTGGSKDRCCDG